MEEEKVDLSEKEKLLGN